jgi:hypothetical protein
MKPRPTRRRQIHNTPTGADGNEGAIASSDPIRLMSDH